MQTPHQRRNSVTSCPVSRSLLFARVNRTFITTHVTTDMAENDIMRIMAMVYLGPCDDGKKYGL